MRGVNDKYQSLPLPGKKLANDLIKTHYGEDSYKHAMAETKDDTVGDIKDKILARTADHMKAYMQNVNDGDFEAAGQEMGQALHYFQDSLTFGHMVIDSQGRMVQAQIYEDQNLAAHKASDHLDYRSDPYMADVERSEGFIRKFMTGDMDAISKRYGVAPNPKEPGVAKELTRTKTAERGAERVDALIEKFKDEDDD